MRMRYGLGGESVHSQHEIADKLGLKQPLVSSVVRRLTARLLG
jgi:DNA-binding MarR family transcriptional regulator